MNKLGINTIIPITKVLKERFPNMTVVETVEFATKIIESINEVLKNESEN